LTVGTTVTAALLVAGYAAICRDRVLRLARRVAIAARSEASHEVRTAAGAAAVLWAVLWAVLSAVLSVVL
jgi:hypothetical protein